MSKRRYVTTAIDYPNAAPHMGHVLEKVLADVCVRWMRLRGDPVRFQIGTDEHGVKIQQAAKAKGMTPAELVGHNVPLFRDLYTRLGISYDVFIRTTDKKQHWPTVQELWKKLEKAGALEKRTYTGLYCSGCERFVTAKDLVDGQCPIHQKEPEQVKEENWFFLLKREADWLKKLLKSSYTIVPDSRANETLALLEQGLEDVSFSRPKSSLAWGIPVPGDDTQTMYVWCDALTNYISGIDIFGLGQVPFDSASLRSGSFDSSSGPRPQPRTMSESALGGRVEWWDDAEVTHVIGKDIARFHALIWPAMLKNAGVRAPDRLLIHGFLTSEGQKMSKSLGNVVVPDDVIAKYGVDALRFYLSHEIPVGNDGDFSWDRFQKIYKSGLSDQIGNLLNRVLVLLSKEGGELHKDLSSSVSPGASLSWTAYAQDMDKLDTHTALVMVLDAVRKLNKDFNDKQIWTIIDKPKKILELSFFAEGLRFVALMLLPFIPETAQKMSKQLGVPYAANMLQKDFIITKEMKQWGGIKDWKTVGEPSILFAPVE